MHLRLACYHASNHTAAQLCRSCRGATRRRFVRLRLDLRNLEQAEVFSRIQSAVGRRIGRVERVFYTHGGTVDRTRGILQLGFDDGTSMHFRGGPDGASVVVETAQWSDPFAAPLSSENREFIEKSGKWTLFDVSNDDPYRELIGEELDSAEPLLHESGAIVSGVRLRIGTATVLFQIEDDEEFVSFGDSGSVPAG